jgi:hypothetical protein
MRWEALFDQMYSLLVDLYGEDGIGINEDQAWIIDDDYGGYEHKIELPSNEKKKEVINGLQKILKDDFKEWTVVVVKGSAAGFDPEGVFHPELAFDPEGVRVSWNSVTR